MGDAIRATLMRFKLPRVGLPGVGLRGAGLFFFVCLALIGSACSEEPQTGFTPDTEGGFMAACTEVVEDTRLVRDVCQCVIDRATTEITFQDFKDTDDRLSQLPELALPQQITDFIAECMIEEADL